MNKQEAIKEVKKLSIEKNGISRDKGNLDGVGFKDEVNAWDVICILEKLDQPQKPVIPQFVAEWIEEKKKSGIDLHKSMTYEVKVDVFKYIMDNSETYARAWLDGYEVEKEQLYTVEIPNPNGDSLTVLEFISDSCIVLSQMESFPDNWKEMDIYHLTESEIKQDFEWAWQFAKEVE